MLVASKFSDKQISSLMRSPAGTIKKVYWCFPMLGLGRVYVRIGSQNRTEAASVQNSPLKIFPPC